MASAGVRNIPIINDTIPKFIIFNLKYKKIFILRLLKIVYLRNKSLSVFSIFIKNEHLDSDFVLYRKKNQSSEALVARILTPVDI